MLVLSRKLNQKIVINGDITVTVVRIDGGQVRLGIQAPHDVRVFREEIAPVSRASQRREELVEA
jgi:carbon storage regulator